MSLPREACRTVLLLLLLVNCSALIAQKEPAIWLFGDHNGIDFRSGTPVAISNPNISYHGREVKGVATVTDANGDLLFYAEDETVYNSRHDTMLNGAQMYGSWAALQTYLTVRAIHDTSLYYLFTIDMHSVAGESYSSADVWYSVIDMKADNGLGAVTTKNVPLLSNSTTQLCAVRHCNERDIWVIAHGWNSNAYYAFLITPAGVSASPVVSRTGRLATSDIHGTTNLFGYMKASPDGKKIATTFYTSGGDLSDFDNATGRVSSTVDLQVKSDFWAYANGVEFSPNSRLLYVNSSLPTADILYQYDVYAGSPAAISASKTEIARLDFFGMLAAMQQRQDGRIYVANYMQPNMSIIHNPDVRGVGCNFEWQALPLLDRSSHGLPAYMESKYYPEPPFTFSAGCPAETVSFSYDKPANVVSVKWDFGDAASGPENTSTELNPVHVFTAEGTYLVQLIRFTACDSDTLEEEVSIKKLSVYLGNDTTICSETGFLLKPVIGGAVDYLWQDGSTNNSLLANVQGLYWLQITDPVSGCSARDSIILDIRPQPVFTLGPDQEVCEPEVLLETSVPASSYQWNTGSSEKSISVSTSGLYWLQVNEGECFYRDSIEVSFNSISVKIGPDTTVCENTALVLDAGSVGLDYTWQDGSKGNSFTVRSPGLYSVTVRNGTCIAEDAVQVDYEEKPVFSLGEDREFCKGNVLILGSQLENIYTYVWEDGSTSPARTIYQPGTFRITGSNACGSFTDEIVVRPGGCVLAVPNAFTPNRDGINDVFRISNTEQLSSFSMQVFNRWGQKIFESRNQAQGWNGELGGRACDSGSYPYVIYYRKADGTQATLKGIVTLIR